MILNIYLYCQVLVKFVKNSNFKNIYFLIFIVKIKLYEIIRIIKRIIIDSIEINRMNYVNKSFVIFK